MAVDFSKLLSVSIDTVKAPVALPAGTYEGIIAKTTFGESKQKGTPFLRVDFNLTAPGADILPEDLVDVELSKKHPYKDYYLTGDAMYRLKELLESLEIPTAGRGFSEAIPDLLQQPVLIEITQRMNPQDPMAPPYNDVGKVTALK